MKSKKEENFTLPDSGVQIDRVEIDNILYTAFNAGGISGWADRIIASEQKKRTGEKVYKHIGMGGSVLIRDMIDNRLYLLDRKRLLKGIDTYISDGYGRIYDGRLMKIVNTNDANCIVQLAIYGEVKYK